MALLPAADKDNFLTDLGAAPAYPIPVVAPPPTGLVARELRFRGFGPFHLTVPTAACLGLSGPSGAGKTLLLRSLADLDPHEGTVTLDGTAQHALPGPAWRRQVGLLPADTLWWHDHVGPHFEPRRDTDGHASREPPGSGPSTTDSCAQALISVPSRSSAFSDSGNSVAGWIADLGFEPDVLDWPVSRLSAGERQRLGILRLLSRRPRCLLLDEPTANLDPDSTARVERLITDYRQSERVPVLWVGHSREQLARVADTRLHLEAGKLQGVDS
ncbi:MAG: ATP-binding cassette domain-containing protein [Verrucomicrobiae bacterium]|nr:ATP-binding cassette domain-containing protein [Verrucomicrobiae bacterium]MCP5524259.1 ATP-binding cassette domain-containing protein [Verrucomicrobiales bacterium]